MQFLKTLLIVLVVAVAVAFGFNNWAPVQLQLWGGLIAEIKLPLLIALCFASGWLPTWLWQRAVRWRLQQRLSASERTIADLRAAAVVPVTADTTAPVSVIDPDPLPAAAPPLIEESRP